MTKNKHVYFQFSVFYRERRAGIRGLVGKEEGRIVGKGSGGLKERKEWESGGMKRLEERKKGGLEERKERGLD
jgi:hypothetical protein